MTLQEYLASVKARAEAAKGVWLLASDGERGMKDEAGTRRLLEVDVTVLLAMIEKLREQRDSFATLAGFNAALGLDASDEELESLLGKKGT